METCYVDVNFNVDVDILFLCRGDFVLFKDVELTQRGKEPWKVGNLQMLSHQGAAYSPRD